MDQPTSLGRTVFYCGHLARLCLENRLRQFGVTPGQAYTMLFLQKRADGEEITQRDLEQELHLKPSTVNGIVERMEEKGFLSRRPSPTDGRCRLMALTEKGEALATHFRSAIDDTEGLFRTALTAEEQHLLEELLAKIIANLESEVQRP